MTVIVYTMAVVHTDTVNNVLQIRMLWKKFSINTL